MTDLLLSLVKAIVDHPDKVVVNQTDNNGQLILELSVDKEDMGQVIGKQGKIIKAIRNLIKIKAIKENRLVDVQLLENN